MPRWFPRHVLILTFLFISVALSGCDNGVFAPPARAGKTSSTASSTVPSRAKEIAFIFPAEDSDDLRVIENLARVEVGRSRAAYVSYRASAGDPSSKQAELIKRAAEGASAIVVVADKARETGEAIAAIDQKRTPIILLGRKPMDAKPAASTLVTWPSFTPSARLIVDAIVEEAKKAGYPDDAPILMLTIDPPDDTSLARDTALIEALKTTGHPIAAKVPMVEDSVSTLAFKNALKAHPKVCAVITDDGIGAGIATAVRIELKGSRNYLLGGYCRSINSLKLVSMNQATIMVDRNLDDLVHKAVSAAIDRSEGKVIPDRIEVEMPIRRASGISTTPLSQSKK